MTDHSPMTPSGLRECLDRLGWSSTELAARADVSPVTARRWLSGKLAIPDHVAHTIGTMAELAAALARKPGANLERLFNPTDYRLVEETA
jgi:hypothetical protein